MRRKIIWIIISVLLVTSVVIAGSLQDSQTGFRNITRTTSVTADISGTADEITVTDNGDGTVTLSIPDNTRYFTNLVSTLADSSASGAVTIIPNHDGTGNKSYHQVSSGSGAQAGVIVQEWIVPEFWSAWVGISIWTQSNDFANCTFTVTLEDGSGNVDSTIISSDIAPTGDDAWEETVLVPGDAVTPGETIRLIFTATNADADDTSWLATDVQISYTASQ